MGNVEWKSVRKEINEIRGSGRNERRPSRRSKDK